MHKIISYSNQFCLLNTVHKSIFENVPIYYLPANVILGVQNTLCPPLTFLMGAMASRSHFFYTPAVSSSYCELFQYVYYSLS